MEIPRCSSLRYFVLIVQPFGLSSTPYIFIECLKPQEKYRNVNGVNIALLLDDGWLIDIDRNSRAVLAANVKSDLKRAGFVTNDEKSQWCPTQIIERLGVVWDAVSGTIRVSNRRELSIAESETLVSARELSSLVGKIISAGAAFGNISRIMTWYCSLSVAFSQDWDSKFHLEQY